MTYDDIHEASPPLMRSNHLMTFNQTRRRRYTRGSSVHLLITDKSQYQDDQQQQHFSFFQKLSVTKWAKAKRNNTGEHLVVSKH